MSKLPKGLGMYIWQVAACEGGNPDHIAATAATAGLGHVLIKVIDGTRAWNISSGGADLVAPLLPVLKQACVEPWGWGYFYGDNPAGEADAAIRRVKALGLPGFVVNAEKEYKLSGRRTAAVTFMNRLRSGLGPDFPIALSSYRYPSYHPEFPWREFLNAVDINMPQVYWMQATNPGWQLWRTVLEFIKMQPSRPIVPTGAAFSEWGWSSTPGQITEFLKVAQELKLPAANFWSWQHARSRPALWEAVAQYPWPFPVQPIPPQPEPVTMEVDMLIVKTALNLRNSPTTGAPIITTMPAGEKVELKEIGVVTNGYPWLKVRIPRTGQVGWCASVIDRKPSVQVV